MIEVNIPFGPIAHIKVSGATANEVLAQITSVENSEIPLTVGRVIKAVESGESLGRNLGASLVEEHPKDQEQAQVPQAGAQQLPDWAQLVPGAPLVNGEPAWFVASENAFVSPNPNTSLPQTNDPNDPRLASGQAMLYLKVK